MKKIYKIILLFIVLFLIGILSFIGYINYSMNKTEKYRAVNNYSTTSYIAKVKNVLF